MDLSEFLLARIDEDEEAARMPPPGPWAFTGEPRETDVYSKPTGVTVAHVWQRDAHHIARHDPARVLAECEAKRQLVQLHQSSPLLDHAEVECTCGFEDHRSRWCVGCGAKIYDEGEFERPYGHCPTLKILALPYADHPDFRAEWAEVLV